MRPTSRDYAANALTGEVYPKYEINGERTQRTMSNQVASRRRRWERSEEVRRKTDAARRYGTDLLKTKWIEYLSQPAVRDSLNYRVDITLKQRRASDLDTVRPAVEAINVRVRPRRLSLREASLLVPYHYLTDEETVKLATRMTSRLNKELFGNRSRRTHKGRTVRNPERLTALVCQHDKNTRRHLHCLFAKPPHVSEESFKRSLRIAMSKEPFIYSIDQIQPVQDLGRSVLYNADDSKSLTQNAIIYVYPQLAPATHEGRTEEEIVAGESEDGTR